MIVNVDLSTVFLLAEVEPALVLALAWDHPQGAELPLLILAHVLNPDLNNSKVSDVEDGRHHEFFNVKL